MGRPAAGHSRIVPSCQNKVLTGAGKPTLDCHPPAPFVRRELDCHFNGEKHESQMARSHEHLVRPGDEHARMDHVETRTLCGDPAAPVRGLWLHGTWLRED